MTKTQTRQFCLAFADGERNRDLGDYEGALCSFQMASEIALEAHDIVRIVRTKLEIRELESALAREGNL